LTYVLKTQINKLSIIFGKDFMVRDYSRRTKEEYNWWREVVYFISYYIALVYFKLFYKIRVEGLENIPKGESFIIAANHLSVLDPVIVGVAIKRPIAFMAKKQLFEYPILREVINMYGAFAVNREKLEVSTIRTARAVVSTKKWVLAMFPQGSREVPGMVTRVTPGAAYLANKTGAKILPVAIVGSDVYNPKPFEGNLVVKIGKPIEPFENYENVMHTWASSICDLTGFRNGVKPNKVLREVKNISHLQQ
jgi:1-acyl-sn-glycerol-3-phosphate acyltransferase